MTGYIMLGFCAWMLVGWVVVEACRRLRPWWRAPVDVVAVLIWPVVLFYTLKEGPDQ